MRRWGRGGHPCSSDGAAPGVAFIHMRPLSITGAVAVFAFAMAGTLVGQDSGIAPVSVSGELRFTSITAGGTHTCGLTAEGRAYCWGRNDAGQLGDSTVTDRPTPVPVVGSIVFRMLTAGLKHTCGISTEDEPYCWGANEHGQLGNGGRTNLSVPFRVATELRAITMSAGAHHTCATQVHWERQGRIVCWGSNSEGQLGDMSEEDSSTPTATFGVIQYVSVAAGDGHTCGVTKAGKLFCWGANVRGQLGNGSATESRVPFLTRMNRHVTFTKVTAGASHTCALTSSGEAYCWGENKDGQVGNGKGGRVLAPTWLRDSPAFASLSAGGGATCGVTPEGTASCWGSNAAGQFGAGVGPGSTIPAPALPGTTWTTLALGRAHACGVRPDGVGLCWGRIGS